MGGMVVVNGEVAESLTMTMKARDRVEVWGREITRPSRGAPVYLMVNKPPGYLSTVRDDRGRKTVMELVPEGLRVPGLVPAGRLDLASTGLMLLTNDGDLVNKVTHPSYGVRKEYNVLLDAALVSLDIKSLLTGVELEDGKASAVSVTRLDEHAYRYTVVLVEGKKREIRMMMRALGRHVRELKRVKMGDLLLGNLEEGKSRLLTSGEVRGLTRSAATKNEARRGLAREGMAPGTPRAQSRRGRPSALPQSRDKRDDRTSGVLLIPTAMKTDQIRNKRQKLKQMERENQRPLQPSRTSKEEQEKKKLKRKWKSGKVPSQRTGVVMDRRKRPGD